MNFRLIIEEAGEGVFNLISNYVKLDVNKTSVQETIAKFEVDILDDNYYDSYINLQRINDIPRINKFFKSVNSKLPVNGVFIGCVENFILRRRRILKKYPRIISRPYYFADFIFKRVVPKLPILKKLYFYITHGRNRVLTLAETLGRLVYCGFEIIKYEQHNGLTYFVTKKIKSPSTDPHPSYGPLFKMKRVGKNGQLINVYKFRTMHPYAEYIQDYVLKINGYNEVGKIANDIRITSWGRFFRKYWIDEMPQLINVLKGEMKLVGARPLSKKVYSEYPEDVKKLRLNHKPGCIPPSVSLLVQSMELTIEAERNYLMDVKNKSPFITDVRYFYKAVYNILSNKIRSK